MTDNVIVEAESADPQEDQSNPNQLSIPQPTSLMEVVAAAAADPTYDLERLEKLIDMRNEELAREARLAYFDAMSRVQEKMVTVVANQKNTHTKSTYADLSAINRMIAPIYGAEGFSLSFSNKPSTTANHLLIMCDVMHRGGHSEHYEYDLPYDNVGAKGNVNKTDIQASGSTVSYGQRYLTTMIFNIATDRDDDGNAAGTGHEQGIFDKTVEDIVKGCEIAGKTQEDCLKYINASFGTAHDRLTQFTEQQGRRMLRKLQTMADEAASADS